MNNLKVAIVGLDTSHSIQFAKRMNDPDCDPKIKVDGLKAVSCMRFETPFQDKEGLDARQKQLEDWGIKVTESFDECVADCDAIMLEINDPAYHLEYFEKAVKLGKPIFLDKPMADTYTSGKAIYDIAKENNAKVFSASSLRFVTAVVEAKKEISKPEFVSVYGALGIAPAGSSVVWYGVHTMEMLQKLMGPGAVSLKAIQDGKGVVCVVKYKNGGRGVAELNTGSYIYGGMVRTIEKSYPFSVDMSMAYTLELEEVAKFFKGEEPSVSIEDTLEVMDLLDTAQRSLDSGKEVNLNGSY
ncbi:MAG TPA: Gfo/Idh/MocA family oxidoreductase [Clostridiaceae bacterium]|jgi:predicted dehydrogenase|nr:Gfo/Idh/MocA family oxidoreductase [Clostridiaceae bacterium]